MKLNKKHQKLLNEFKKIHKENMDRKKEGKDYLPSDMKVFNKVIKALHTITVWKNANKKSKT